MDATPILDDHLHLHPDGKGVEAAREFARAGGTHLIVINRPSWHLVDRVEDDDSFRETFEVTLDLVEGASEALPGRAWAVLGVHPVLLTHLVEDRDWALEDATDLMRTGLATAAEYVDAGRAIGLKSGRPHFPVDDALWDASNDLIEHAFALAAERGCAVQLHAEDTEAMDDVAALADGVGLDPTAVVKHYAGGPVGSVVPSVIARQDAIDAIVATDDPFMLETDFLDDPERPGAVLGPKLVARRSRELADAGHDVALRRAHVETPELVYGVDTAATLG